MERMCERAVGAPVLVELPVKDPYRRRAVLRQTVVQPRCDGPLRTLYVREIAAGAAKGWRAVGTICLRCHEVRLQEERLPGR